MEVYNILGKERRGLNLGSHSGLFPSQFLGPLLFLVLISVKLVLLHPLESLVLNISGV